MHVSYHCGYTLCFRAHMILTLTDAAFLMDSANSRSVTLTTD